MPLVRKPPRGDAAAPSTSAPDIPAGLRDADEEVRWAAARAAAGRDDLAAAVSRAVRQEASPRVREALLTSLAHSGGPGAGALQSLLRSDDADLRGGALDALRTIVRRRHDYLPALLADEDADVRILSCELARMLPAAQATALLAGLLRHEREPNVCAAAVDVLAEAGQPDALPALQDCAARFAGHQFLTFAIQVAIDRIRAHPPRPRG